MWGSTCLTEMPVAKSGGVRERGKRYLSVEDATEPLHASILSITASATGGGQFSICHSIFLFQRCTHIFLACALLQVTGRAFLGETFAGGVATAPVRGLKRLDLPNCPRLDPSAVEWIAAGCTDLRSLVVSGCTSTRPEGVELLAASHPDLLRLGVAGCEGLGRSTALAFVAGRSGSYLRYLDISDNPATAAADVGSLLRSCGRLESVDLSGLTKINRSSFRGLGGGRPRTPANGRTTADRACNNQTFSVEASGGSGGEMEGPNAGKHGTPGLPHLRVARMLRLPGLDDASLLLFAAACPGLEELRVSDSPKVTGACLAPLATLCPLLRSMGLDRCSAASDEASLADTCRRLPDLENLGLGVALEDDTGLGWKLTGAGGGRPTNWRASSRRAPYGGALDISSSCSSSVTGDRSRDPGSGHPLFTGETLLAAASSFCKRLQTLGLEGHKRVSFSSGQCPPGAFPCITELRLAGCAGVDDAGLVVLLRACPRVRSLWLQGSAVSQEGLERSVSSLHLPFVEVLPPAIIPSPARAGESRSTVSSSQRTPITITTTTVACLGQKPPGQHQLCGNTTQIPLPRSVPRSVPQPQSMRKHHPDTAALSMQTVVVKPGTTDSASTVTTAATDVQPNSNSNISSSNSGGGKRSVLVSERAMATGLRPAMHHKLHLAAAAVLSRFDEEQRALETLGRALRHFRDRRSAVVLASARAICRGMLAYRFRTNNGQPDKVQ